VNDGITTYLNDHLAGSAAALELLDHMIALQKGPQVQELAAIRSEVKQDQETLTRLLEQAGGSKSRVRTALAWLGEKIGQAKLRLDDPGTGQLQTLEALEALALGIQGKVALWRSLEVSPAFQGQGPEWSRLQRRALDQFNRVEQLRLQAARVALSL
jgi:hypothetical protein